MLKSVRVRSKDTSSIELDIRVNLIKINNKEYLIEWIPNGSYKSKFNYDISRISQSKKDNFENVVKNNLTDKQVIKGFNKNYYNEYDIIINESILQQSKLNSIDYEIIQDPWLEEAPIIRNFGSDPYYLNNGSMVNVEWNRMGGKKWSDKFGKELNSIDGLNKQSIEKVIVVYAPEYYNGKNKEISINSSNEIISADLNKRIFVGTTKDLDIIKYFIDIYKSNIPNYDLKLCENDFCNELEYIDPLVEIGLPDSKEDNQTQNKNKEKINVIIPSNIFKVNEDLSIEVFIGDSIEENSDEFQFGDEFEGDENLLDEEYKEIGFEGEETKIIDGDKVLIFDTFELERDNDSKPSIFSSNNEIITPANLVSDDDVELPSDLNSVRNSHIIKKQSLGNDKYRSIYNNIIAPNGSKIDGNDIVRDMNSFILDVLGPFSTFLKNKYPFLYNKWYITSATRGYIPVGGSTTSQHLRGQAIDSQIIGSTSMNPSKNIKLLNSILEWYETNKLGYGQILFETKGDSCWIHWSYKRGYNKLQLSRFKNHRLINAPVNTIGSYVSSDVTESTLGFV